MKTTKMRLMNGTSVEMHEGGKVQIANGDWFKLHHEKILGGFVLDLGEGGFAYPIRLITAYEPPADLIDTEELFREVMELADNRMSEAGVYPSLRIYRDMSGGVSLASESGGISVGIHDTLNEFLLAAKRKLLNLT
jgi:hypothetical protein